MSATVTARQYSGGTKFYTVECGACHAGLNSGHHYSQAGLPFAQQLADEHNAQHHKEQS